MQRTALRYRHFLISTLVILSSISWGVFPVFGKQKDKDRVLIKVTDSSRISQLARKYGFNVKKSVSRGTAAMFVVENIPSALLKKLLKYEAGIDFIADDDVFPLDGGETVLPLDGGETVLPLGPVEPSTTPQTIGELLDGGETVLPLEQVNAIGNGYGVLAGLVTPSERLLIQASFAKIGLYTAVSHATGRGVIIADIDTGADTCHEALQGIVTYTFVEGPDANAPENCATASTPHVPGFGHGTAVASLLRVVAPEATIWAMRVFDNTGSAQVSDVYEAIVFAADHGVDVINMSFGTNQSSQALEDAMAYARQRGVVLVAAGGNSNAQPLMYPAAIAGVKGVVATGVNDVKASFTNYGTAASYAAPATGLWVAYPNHLLTYVAGTSYASPLVAAEAALVIDAYSRVSSGNPPASVIDGAMVTGALSIDSLNPLYLNKLGHGRIYLPLAIGAAGLQ